jgi:hypothetical protein
VSEQIEPVLAMSRALAHAGTFNSTAKAELAAERERILASLVPAEEFPLPVSHNGSALLSDTVNVVVGTTHMTHRFEAKGTGDPHLRVEYLARADDADLISVYTNVDHAAMTPTDPSLISCHNLAEAGALALGEKPDFISLKGQLLEVLLGQRALRRALRNSLKERREEPAQLAQVAAISG